MTPCSFIELVNGDLRLSLLAISDTGSSISAMDLWIVSTLHLHGRKASFSEAVIHGSQDVSREILVIAVSAHEKFRILTRILIYFYENMMSVDQSVDLQ